MAVSTSSSVRGAPCIPSIVARMSGIGSASFDTRTANSLVKDLAFLNYSETRPDVDPSKLGYFGLSRGARMGPIVTALDGRIRASVLLGGGLDSYTGSRQKSTSFISPRDQRRRH